MVQSDNKWDLMGPLKSSRETAEKSSGFHFCVLSCNHRVIFALCVMYIQRWAPTLPHLALVSGRGLVVGGQTGCVTVAWFYTN